MQRKIPKKFPGEWSEHDSFGGTVNAIIDYLEYVDVTLINLRGGYTNAEIDRVSFKNDITDHTLVHFTPWPQLGDMTYRLNSGGDIIEQPWTNSAKLQKIRDFTGIYRTKEEAEQRKEEILGKK